MNRFTTKPKISPGRGLRLAEPPTLVGRSERHKAEKLQRIKLAARKLFGRKGFERTSVSEIAHAADVGVGTVFLYAKSKEQLLVLCFRDEVGSAMDEGFRTAPPRASLLDQVMHVFGVMVAHTRLNLDLWRVFAREIPFASEDPRRGVKEVMDGFFRHMESLIHAACRRGELRLVNSGLLAHNLFALYFGFLLSWVGSSAKSPELITPGLRESLELQLVGLVAQKPENSDTRPGRKVAPKKQEPK